MGVQYIFGRSGRGKSHFVLEQIKNRLQMKSEHKLILIVPEQFTLQAERNLIEKLDLPGIMDIEVLSFTRLAHNILNEVGGLTRIHLNEQGKSMVLRKIIDEVNQELTLYKKACQQSGFVTMFSELLCELKQQDLLPIDLRLKLEKLQKDSTLYYKLQDVAYIYEQFNHYLHGRYMDTEDYMNLLIEKIEEADFLRDSEIWIDEFYSFTPQMYRIIEKLMIMTNEIHITLPIEFTQFSRDGDLFKIPVQTFQTIHQIALQNGLSEQRIDLNKEKQEDIRKFPEIAYIEQEFYAYPYKYFDGKIKNIDLFAGVSPQTEIENVAGQIVTLVRDRGYRWRDIAVVCNNIKDYGEIIRRVFEEYAIPYFLDQKRPIMHNPIIELLLSCLATIDRGYRYEDIFRLLKTGFAGLQVDEYEKIENYVLQYGIKGNKWKIPFTYGEENLLEELNKSREKFIEPIHRLEKKVKTRKTVADITRALYDYLQEIGTQEQLKDWIDRLRGKGQYESVSENTQIWNIVMGIFDQMVEIIGDQKINLKEYLRVLESGFLAMEIGIIPTTIDQVLVGNIQRSKSHEIKALFIVGVNDGVLPSGKNEDGILSDEERIVLKEEGLRLGLDSEKKVSEEKFIIYSTISKPNEYLWISYALADQEGKAMRPSILINRFQKLFKGIQVQSDIIDTIEQQRRMVSTPKSTFKYLVEKIRANADGKPIEDLWWNVYQWYYHHKEWDDKRNALIQGLFHDNQVAYIESSNAKKLYRVPIRASVSRLEKYVNCPFAHFIKYGLRPKEREIYKVEAPDIGEIFHSSMELFTRKLKQEKIDWRQLGKEQCAVIVEDVVDQIIPNHKNGVLLSTYRYQYLIHQLKRISHRAVWTLTEHLKKSEFEPLGYEVAFGLGQLYPPIEIELADGEKIYLEGRIDRIDILEDEEAYYVNIIDYKSGNKEFSLSDVYYGFQLQLMIYLNSILNHKDKLGKKPVRPAGIFYFKIDDPMIQTKEKVVEVIEKEIRKKLKMKGLVLKDVQIVQKMDSEIEGYSDTIPVGLNKDGEFYDRSSVMIPEGFEALISHVRKLVQQIAHEMIRGNIQIEPSKNGQQTACDYCRYREICEFDSMFEGNVFKNTRKLSDKEVIERIMQEKEGDSDGKVDTGSTECDSC